MSLLALFHQTLWITRYALRAWGRPDGCSGALAGSSSAERGTSAVVGAGRAAAASPRFSGTFPVAQPLAREGSVLRGGVCSHLDTEGKRGR